MSNTLKVLDAKRSEVRALEERIAQLAAMNYGQRMQTEKVMAALDDAMNIMAKAKRDVDTCYDAMLLLVNAMKTVKQ